MFGLQLPLTRKLWVTLFETLQIKWKVKYFINKSSCVYIIASVIPACVVYYCVCLFIVSLWYGIWEYNISRGTWPSISCYTRWHVELYQLDLPICIPVSFTYNVTMWIVYQSSGICDDTHSAVRHNWVRLFSPGERLIHHDTFSIRFLCLVKRFFAKNRIT